MRNQSNNKFLPYLLGIVFIVLLMYLPSLFRSWLPFDETFFYQETHFPIPVSFTEIPEIIKYFIFNYHIESMNNFFSSILNVRSNPIITSFMVFISFFFKNEAILYHICQLILHIINTVLVFFIFKKIVDKHYFLISLFTLLWSLHSASTEAVLLTTNWTAVLTYTFCFALILHEVNVFSKPNNQLLKPSRILIISVLFSFVMLLTEYALTFPFILLFLIYTFRRSVLISLKQAVPYFIGLLIYLIISNAFLVLSPLSSVISRLFIERNLWLTPQIFIHLLKLIISPKTLSIYQSNLTILGEKLIEPYTVFCTVFYLLFLLLPLILFFLTRKKAISYIFILIYSFYFSLFPFLHIITPTYCLSADRYCYFPSFFFYFFLFNFIIHKIPIKKAILILFICMFAMSARTLIRVFEWTDSYKLYESALNIEKNLLYKSQKHLILANYVEDSKKNHLVANELLKNSLYESYIAVSKLRTERNVNQPLILKEYGLDKKSLLLKAVYLHSKIKYDYFKEPLEPILAFYESYINNKLDYLDVGQFIFYADLLLKSGQLDKARRVLEYGLNKYPLSSAINFSLINVYLNYYGDLNKAYDFLELAYKYYPNASFTLHRFYDYYVYINNPSRQAHFAYLIGLRDHSIEYYKKALNIYRELNDSEMSRKAEKKITELELRYN